MVEYYERNGAPLHYDRESILNQQCSSEDTDETMQPARRTRCPSRTSKLVPPPRASSSSLATSSSSGWVGPGGTSTRALLRKRTCGAPEHTTPCRHPLAAYSVPDWCSQLPACDQYRSRELGGDEGVDVGEPLCCRCIGPGTTPSGHDARSTSLTGRWSQSPRSRRGRPRRARFTFTRPSLGCTACRL